MQNKLPSVLGGVGGLAAVAAVAASVAGPPGVGLMVGLAAALLICAAIVAHSPRLGAMATAVLAFALNAYLFSRKWESAKATEAICNVSSYLNCDKVNASPWSEAFGVPITLLGMGFYAGLAMAAAVKDEEARRFHQLNLAFAGFSLLYSAFLGYQSYAMGALCVMCVGIYGANALLAWAGWSGLQKQAVAWDPMELGTSRDFLTIVSVFLVVVATGGWAYSVQKAANPVAAAQAGSVDDATLARLYTEPCGVVETDGTEPTVGPASAKYAIVEWADYACPHCASASADLKRYLAENPDVKLTFKVFPLAAECNEVIQGSGPEKCEAAYAAECARPQGKYFEMSRMLFENQGYFAPADLEFMANQVGLDVPTWKACLQDPATRASALQDAAAGVRAEVHGTPAMFLKGTHGDRFILIQGGVPGLGAVIEAHRSGRPMPPAPPCAPDQH